MVRDLLESAPDLCVVEVDLVSLMAAVPKAVVTQHARLVLLALLADPHDVVLLEGVLADLVRRHVAHALHLCG